MSYLKLNKKDIMAHKIRSSELLGELKDITLGIIHTYDNVLLPAGEEKLNKQPNEKSWSAAQCIEHLNRYSKYYIPQFEKCLKNKDTDDEIDEWYKPGWLGNLLAKSMKPRGEKIPNKMQTFKNMNPIYRSVDPDVFHSFKEYQEKTLEILEKAEDIDLAGCRVPTTLSKLIKMKFGDALRLLIWHNQRHMIQATRALST
jgi:hypothetical protein